MGGQSRHGWIVGTKRDCLGIRLLQPLERLVCAAHRSCDDGELGPRRTARAFQCVKQLFGLGVMSYSRTNLRESASASGSPGERSSTVSKSAIACSYRSVRPYVRAQYTR